jgi:hypothetical protein
LTGRFGARFVENMSGLRTIKQERQNMKTRTENLTEFFIERHYGKKPSENEMKIIEHLSTLGGAYDAFTDDRRDIRRDRKMSESDKEHRLAIIKRLEDQVNKCGHMLRSYLNILRVDPNPTERTMDLYGERHSQKGKR